jgi:uncharacterized membrane protein YeaQ/YmgE (transglycosylase-associated protein family)
MDLITWLIVGLIAGLLASFVIGGVGYGLLGDIVIGIVGAVFGGWLFSQLNIKVPFGGLTGTIFVAFVGAVVLLLILRAVRPRRSV